jgi:hypothetical protein
MTIHHSCWDKMQGKTGRLGEKSGKGERLAMAMRRFRRAPFAADDRLLVRTEFVTNPFARE